MRNCPLKQAKEKREGIAYLRYALPLFFTLQVTGTWLG
jgi:hypothetical protein